MISGITSVPAHGGGFPRYFRIGGHQVNAYKVFLCVGIYTGILLSAATARASGLSPLRVGAGCFVCALLGMFGARAYHLAVNFRAYRQAGFKAAAWNTDSGGWSLFGALIIVPVTLVLPSMFGVPVAVFWDHLAVGIAFGGACVRFGCWQPDARDQRPAPIRSDRRFALGTTALGRKRRPCSGGCDVSYLIRRQRQAPTPPC